MTMISEHSCSHRKAHYIMHELLDCLIDVPTKLQRPVSAHNPEVILDVLTEGDSNQVGITRKDEDVWGPCRSRLSGSGTICGYGHT
jgi:hypothetical protein